MRTVHETEALRPSDPVPKHHSSNPQNKAQRVRLTFKASASTNGDLITKVEAPKSIKSNTSAPPSPSTAPTIAPADHDYEYSNVLFLPSPTGSAQEMFKQFPPDIHFTEPELSLPAPQLYNALRYQLQELNAESEELRKELEFLDARRKHEWTAKELLLENVLEGDLAVEARRVGPYMASEGAMVMRMMKEDLQPALNLDYSGDNIPWWREQGALSMGNLQLAEREATGAMVKMERGPELKVIGDEIMGSS